MTDITLPRDALEAAKNAWYANQHKGTDERMSAACLAMIKAWPGMAIQKDAVVRHRFAVPAKRIILPIPQESGEQFDQKEDQQRMWDIAAEVSRHGESEG